VTATDSTGGQQPDTLGAERPDVDLQRRQREKQRQAPEPRKPQRLAVEHDQRRVAGPRPQRDAEEERTDEQVKAGALRRRGGEPEQDQDGNARDSNGARVSAAPASRAKTTTAASDVKPASRTTPAGRDEALPATATANAGHTTSSCAPAAASAMRAAGRPPNCRSSTTRQNRNGRDRERRASRRSPGRTHRLRRDHRSRKGVGRGVSGPACGGSAGLRSVGVGNG
jgi:hypothetical protein